MNKKTWKSIGAVFAGFVTVFVLSVVTDLLLENIGVFPTLTNPQGYTNQMFAVALLYRLAYAAAGGFVTAKLAPDKPMKHVVILAVIGFVFGLLGTIANWDKTSSSALWYPIGLAILSPVFVWLGGKWEMKKHQVVNKK